VAGSVRELLGDRRFASLLVSRGISVYGSSLGPVALAFGILGLPHATPTRLSVVEAANLLPMLLFILLGGVIADRRSRMRLLVVAESVSGVAWAGIAVLIGVRHAPTLALVALAFVAGCGIAILAPTMSGVVPELVPADKLQSGNAVLRITINGSRVLGLASAGVLVAYAGAGWALGVDAATYAISAVLLFSTGPGAAVVAATTPLLADLRAGAREFFSRQWLWVIVAVASFMVAVSEASVGVLGPIVAKEHYGGARAWSAIAVAGAVGTIAGSGLALRLKPRRPLLVASVAGFGLGAPMLALGLPLPLAGPVIAAFAAGVAVDVFGVLWDTTMQREIAPDMLSRVSAYDWLGSIGLAPIGLVAAGPLATAFGARHAELGCAGVTVLASALALLSPQVRQLRAPDEPPRKQPRPTGVAQAEEV
jgi:MFS family permease